MKLCKHENDVQVYVCDQCERERLRAARDDNKVAALDPDWKADPSVPNGRATIILIDKED